MSKHTVFIQMDSGKLINPKPLKTILSSLQDGKYKVDISTMNIRSLNQNSYYWLIITDYVQPALYNLGWSDIKTKEAAHEFVADLFLKQKQINEQTFEQKTRTRSTTELTKEEFNIYLEEIWRWAAEYLSISIPAPNEQFVLYKQ